MRLRGRSMHGTRVIDVDGRDRSNRFRKTLGFNEAILIEVDVVLLFILPRKLLGKFLPNGIRVEFETLMFVFAIGESIVNIKVRDGAYVLCLIRRLVHPDSESNGYMWLC